MPMRVCTGFEFGTTAGWATGNTGNKVIDTISGTPAIVTTAPRTGTYCLEISTTAATESTLWDTNTLAASQNRLAAGFGVYFPTSLPATDVILAQVNIAAGINILLEFNQATTKFRIGFEGGNNIDGPTVTANTWYYVEFHLDTSANPHVLDWVVDTVAQTQVTQAQALTTITSFRLGTSNSSTFTARYDDLVVWTDTADITFPLGKHTVRLLSVDPAGTVTLSGTAGNFNTFTANGTLAAWNATTARDNIDEVPPTISASADGWVQITLAASDYVEMPMTTYTLAGGESISGVRMLAPGWATSTTAATIGFRSWNGTTETTLFATADPNFDNSTTTPGWVCKMLTLADVDTQAELDALAFRVGFSGDATPDIGIHAIYAEVAAKESTSVAPDDAPTHRFVTQYGGYF